MSKEQPNNYATSSQFEQARDFHGTSQEAEDHAQYMADEYLIPYHAWSLKSMRPEDRGEHRWHVVCMPIKRKRTKRSVAP